MIPGIDRGVPILLYFPANADIVRSCLEGGGGIVGGQVGIIYFHYLGYVYVRCLDMFMFVLSQFSFRFVC